MTRMNPPYTRSHLVQVDEADGSSTHERASNLLLQHHIRPRSSGATACIRALKQNQNLWIGITVLSVLVWMFSMIGTFHCSFLLVEQIPLQPETTASPSSFLATFNTSSPATTEAPTSQVVGHPLGVGLFSTTVYDLESNMLGCVSYYGSSDEFDGAFHAARAFGLLTAMATTLAVICVSLVTLFWQETTHHHHQTTVTVSNEAEEEEGIEATSRFINVRDKLWSTARFLFFSAFLCQLLTFLAFGRELCHRTDTLCHAGPASVLSMFNLFFLCLQSALIYVVPPVAVPLFLFQRHNTFMTTVDADAPNHHKPIPGITIEDTDRNLDRARYNSNKVASRQGKSNLQSCEETGEGEEGVECFEILSIQPSSAVSSVEQRHQRFQERLGRKQVATATDDDDDDILESDIDSEHGKEQSKSSTTMIMEGIECVVEADQSRTRGAKYRAIMQEPWWQSCVDEYYAIGRQRGYRMTVAVVMSLCWIFTLVGVTRCTFLLVGAKGQDKADYSGLGLFNRAYYYHDDILGCISYPPAASGDFDQPFEVGRAFGTITLLLMTTAFVSFFGLHGFTEVSHHKKKAWLALTQCTVPCAFVSQLITFSVVKTESCTHHDSVECVLGVAGVFAMLNVLLLFPLAIFIFAVPCPSKPMFRLSCSVPPSVIPPVAPSHVEQYKEQQKRRRAPQPDPSATNTMNDDWSCELQDDGVRVRRFGLDPIRKMKKKTMDPPARQEKNVDPPAYHEPAKEDDDAEDGRGMTASAEQPASFRSNRAAETPDATNNTGTGTATSATNMTEPNPLVWDDRASVEQFETAGIMGDNTAIEIELMNRVAEKVEADAMVQATAMSIMLEMLKEEQEEEERTKRQQEKARTKKTPDPSSNASSTSGDEDEDAYDADASSFSCKSSTEYCMTNSDDGKTFQTGEAISNSVMHHP